MFCGLIPLHGRWFGNLCNREYLIIRPITCCFYVCVDVFLCTVDACTLDVGPMLCLLWCWRFRLLFPHLPERGGVVLPTTGLEEPQYPPHTTCTTGKGPKETGENTTHKHALCAYRKTAKDYNSKLNLTMDMHTCRYSAWEYLLYVLIQVNTPVFHFLTFSG